MNSVIYKTAPRLFMVSTTLLGSIFFALLAWLMWTSADKPPSRFIYIILTLLLIFSIAAFYYFITLKIIKVYPDSFSISCMLLPFEKVYPLQEIKTIWQSVRDVVVDTPRFSSVYTFTEFKTLIVLKNGNQIKLYTISPIDFAGLSKTFNK